MELIFALGFVIALGFGAVYIFKMIGDALFGKTPVPPRPTTHYDISEPVETVKTKYGMVEQARHLTALFKLGLSDEFDKVASEHPETPTDEVWDLMGEYFLELSCAGINFRKNISQFVGWQDAILIPEPNNPHDPNAIRVEIFLEAAHVGYIPSSETARVREYLKGEVKNHRCYIDIEQCEDEDDRKFYVGHIYILNPECGNK